eukprot:6539923-Prorocentrum_lima.AAC.1
MLGTSPAQCVVARCPATSDNARDGVAWQSPLPLAVLPGPAASGITVLHVQHSPRQPGGQY